MHNVPLLAIVLLACLVPFLSTHFDIFLALVEKNIEHPGSSEIQ